MSFLPRRFPATTLAALAVSGMCLPFLAAPAVAVPFTAGTLVVERVGNGSATLSSTSTQISILEVTTLGGLAQTITLDTTGSNQQSDSGSASSNGYLNTYFSGTVGYVSVPGYNNAVGTASVTSQNTKVNSTLDASGSVINRTLFPTGGPSGTPPSPFSGNNYRSSLATSGSTFYAAGTASGTPATCGMWYFNGSAFTQVSSTATGQPTNFRNVEIYNNQLYFSSSSGTFLGVSSLGSGLTTSGPLSPTLQINAGAGASTYGFVMFATGSAGTGVLDLAYLADDRSTAGGGIQKYTFNGTAWSNSWSLLVGASGTSILQSGAGVGFAGLRGLAGTYDAVNGATLYATTTETSNNRLISILDTGLTTPSTYTTLQSAGANYAFRGVDLSPVAVPEPSAIASLGCAAALYAMLRRRR
ncbi:MAG: PEP-CTERM sorting domain-containing protein [Planctomycetaceae bacterium]